MKTLHKVLIMAGGTGGHIFPALAVAQALQQHQIEIAWLGNAASMEADIAQKAGFSFLEITVKGLRGKGWARRLAAPWQLLQALIQALQKVQQYKPDLVIGFGGYVSGPGGLASFLLRVPLCVQEQNAVAGYTNRILAKMARCVFAAFPTAFIDHPKIQITGNPLRKAILGIPAPEIRLAKRQGAVKILVMGGSQGAKAFNESLPQILSPLLKSGEIEVYHQTGVAQLEAVKAAYGDISSECLRVLAFIDKVEEAYAWADAVIARAGAATVSELAAVGLASVLIPYPHAVDDHQTKNAEYLAKAKAAYLLPQDQLSQLEAVLKAHFLERALLFDMSVAAYALGHRQATQQIVSQCLGVFRGKK